MAATLESMMNTFNSKIEAPVRTHLKSVYASLALSILSAAGGAYIHMFTNLLRGGGILFSLVGLGLAMGLHFTPDNGKNRNQRMAMLLGFAFLSGLGMGPMLDMAVRLNPAIVPNAFLLSSVIFACFSGAALFAPNGQYLALGGTLMSAMSMMFWLGLANLFFQSQLIFQVYLWGGLLLFCGFIVYDTQMIIEKRRRGDKDFIAHSLDLFIDFIQIFRKILIILMQKQGEKEDNRERRRRR
ncbi:probable Bax inhibitor 1 isoform X1 [Tigriopus californicus]|uniref:probable Bax inhibitor 1 isoform X1 n=1 Tax=Tigriopus californicus TaxID=6832 RepID=UPI0027DA3553|nr:probable Bax inhibitor 1 isoform X1 [Tigriopus californicus]